MTAELTQQEIDNQIDAAIAREPEQIFEPKACEVVYDIQSRKIVIQFVIGLGNADERDHRTMKYIKSNISFFNNRYNQNN